MYKTTSFILITLALLFTGCLRSLHPLYTDKDIVFDKKIEGIWASIKDHKDMWIFHKSEDNAYDLIHAEKDAPAKFQAHLVKLGKYLFLDIFPDQIDTKNDFYRTHFLSVHTFSRIWFKEDTLSLAILDNDWMKDMISQNKISIQHEQTEEGIVLIASTEELQKFVLTYAEDPQAFPQSTTLVRKK